MTQTGMIPKIFAMSDFFSFFFLGLVDSSLDVASTTAFDSDVGVDDPAICCVSFSALA